MQCERCNKNHNGSFGSGKFCSRQCANSRGPRSKEFKEKITQAWNSKRITKSKRITLDTKICPLCLIEFTPNRKIQRHCSRLCARKSNIKKATEEILKNPPDWSAINSKSYREGKNYVAGGTTKWYTYKDIKVQGTYELRMCYILDKMLECNQIKSWEYTNDRISYYDVNGKQRMYLLDFKVFDDDGFEYIETKGRTNDNDELKWTAVTNKGFRLRVLFNNDIKLLESKYNIM